LVLRLHKHTIETVALGSSAGLADGVLTVDPSALATTLKERDNRLVDVGVGLAEPGTATRIVGVKDVVQPRLKIAGEEVGDGDLLVVENLAVVTSGPIVGFQEGIIDMAGPGAAYSPFSQMPLVVLDLTVTPGLEGHDHEAALREAGLHAATLIADSCRNSSAPAAIEKVEWAPLPDKHGLPRIAYVYMVLSQGLLHDTFVMGRNAREGLPLIVDPLMVMDNGIVSGNCVSACDKNTTYHHQNNPVIAELLNGHGTMWDFAGVVVTNEPVRLVDKERSAAAAIELTVGLKPDGAIVTKEGFGNPDADLMMILRGLEAAGVRSVAVTDEFAGTDGGSQSLADSVPEADAIVSTGNTNVRIELPPMATVLGPLPDVPRLAGGYPHSLRDDGSMEVELQAIIGATNELGYGRLSCREA